MGLILEVNHITDNRDVTLLHPFWVVSKRMQAKLNSARHLLNAYTKSWRNVEFLVQYNGI